MLTTKRIFYLKKMKMYRRPLKLSMIWLSFLLLIKTKEVSSSNNLIRIGNGYLSKVINEITVYSALQCSHRCCLKSSCKSHSFNKLRKNCKLHAGKLKDDGITFTSHQDWEHYELKQTDYDPGTQQNPLKSCKELIGSNKPSGYYWLKYPDGGRVFETFCGMDVDGGGWTKIAGFGLNSNYTNIKSNNLMANSRFSFLTSNVEDLKFLKSNADVALSASTVKQLVRLTSATQLRIFCKSGTTIHLATAKDQLGFAVLEYFSDVTKTTQPGGCNSFYRLEGDNSRMTQDCGYWANGLWGHTTYFKTEEYKLYNYVAHRLGKYNIIGNILCDDQITENANIAKKWEYYIR